jgi:hypothetical protein
MDDIEKALKERRRELQRAYDRKKREEAWLIRWWLFDTMGLFCTMCGAVDVPLQFDHPNGRNWEPNRLNCYVRAKRYLQDWSTGNLRVVCVLCNRIDGANRRWANAKRKVYSCRIS